MPSSRAVDYPSSQGKLVTEPGLYERMLSVAVEEARLGLQRGRHTNWGGGVYPRRRVGEPGAQPEGSRGRPQRACRDRCISAGRASAELSRTYHGDHTGTLLVLQRTAAAVSVCRAGGWGEPNFPEGSSGCAPTAWKLSTLTASNAGSYSRVISLLNRRYGTKI